jgi:hypothetical protein
MPSHSKHDDPEPKGKNHEDPEPEPTPTPEPEPTEEDEFLTQEEAAATAQSPGEPQVVPEVRPQAFISPSGGDSEAGKRAKARTGKAMSKEAYDRANSQEAKDEAEQQSRKPRLWPGQRVQIIPPNEEAGRMAFVQAPQFPTAVDQLIGNSGTSEARFAPVTSYVVQTRDGRSDIFDVPADELAVLEPNQGWGRGQI